MIDDLRRSQLLLLPSTPKLDWRTLNGGVKSRATLRPLPNPWSRWLDDDLLGHLLLKRS